MSLERQDLGQCEVRAGSPCLRDVKECAFRIPDGVPCAWRHEVLVTTGV